jgi:hypothetical protein
MGTTFITIQTGKTIMRLSLKVSDDDELKWLNCFFYIVHHLNFIKLQFFRNLVLLPSSGKDEDRTQYLLGQLVELVSNSVQFRDV